MTDQNKVYLTSEQLNELDAASLLEMDIAEFKDLEALVPKPTGVYAFMVEGFEVDTVGADNKTAIKTKLKILECLELENEAEQEDVGELPGNYMELFVLEKNKGYGIRKFATIFRALAEANGVTSPSDIMNVAVGQCFSAVLKKRSYKDKETKEVKFSSEIQADTVNWA